MHTFFLEIKTDRIEDIASKILWSFLEDFTWKYDKKIPGFNSNLQV